MQQQWSSKLGLRRRAIAGAIGILLAPLAVAQSASGQQEAGGAALRVYSVINLGPDAGAAALLNERGQAAFGSIGYTGISNGFFDGDRIRDIGTLGGSYTWVWGLNNHGVVVGESEDGEEHSNILGFRWTAGGGIRALAGTSVSSARAINDRHYIVGLTASPGISARAIRWNPGGSVTPLGPLPLSLSEAFDINQGGMATGFADVASGAIHAMLWDRAGNPTDLGTLGGQRAFGMHINECNAVAGESDTADERTLGFFWSRDSGMVPIPVEGGGSRLVAGLNNRGEVVGDTTIGARSVAYQWSLGRGVVELPSGSAARSDVFDINNNSDMVGLIERRAVDGGGLRAVYWPGIRTPVDLNTRLHKAPAGLVLEAAAAINDDGVILAHSNAGLVMLRPGTRGTDAPVLGPIAGLPDTITLGQDLTLTVGFVDNDGAQTHRAGASWGDGCPAPAPALSEARGVGQVRLQHRFCAAGFYTVKVLVADSGGRYTQVQRDIVVEAPAFASLSGKGTLGNGVPLRFALWAPLGNSASGGSASVILSGPFHFRSDQVSTATAAGQQARVEGTGQLNGRRGYRFLLEAWDGGAKSGASPDRLRVRVTHADAATGAQVADFDNGTPDRTIVVEGKLSLRR